MIGTLQKMRTHLDENQVAQYVLPVGEQELNLNELIGKKLELSYTGNIYCSSCGAKTKKSYSQGHCFVCMRKLASCDMCIMKPETCHYEQGTCREPKWGEENCYAPHYVYLSNTSGLKVGITRHTQVPTRWIDQGATQGLTILKVESRHISGRVEVELAKHIADKTQWQAMLKGHNDDIDLKAKADELLPTVEQVINEICMEKGEYAIERLDADIQKIDYPIEEFPTKVKSFNFDKDPLVSGILKGIKGQYLIFDNGVINIRKFGAYEVMVEVE
ncbi:DUF2797 domain-containing protein [Catenovulum sp. SM1970]|uniref:DUF2797 domain-containing protein n=1 Tax=Marinifaba aquimaris TaxID=2741323 RepID=UPI0015747CB1|nr:DUF2797 domain-containing protein [Marinifaba aquimaris]NTS77200.1 DUF2797 domain-containing protein [Marinifaba aquimaris]